MPKKLERKLRAEAHKKHLKGKRLQAYVYGTLQRITDWKPRRNKKR